MQKTNKTWTVYKHTCIINNKSYIGITCQKLNRRFGNNGRGYTKKNQFLFAHAIEKYGWKNFKTIILEKNILTLEEANRKEKYWIAYYHTWIHDKECQGYNLTEGGDGSPGHKVSRTARIKMSERAKNRLFITNGKVNKVILKTDIIPEGFWKGKTISEASRKNIQEAAKKYAYKQKGKIISQKQREAISKANKGRKLGPLTSDLKEKQKKSRKQNALLRGYYWKPETIKKRANSLKNRIWITNGEVSKMINKNASIPEGFWRGQTESKKKQEAHLHQRKKVLCVETNITYNSVSEAAKAVNKSVSTICGCLKDLSNKLTCAGYHWKYIV